MSGLRVEVELKDRAVSELSLEEYRAFRRLTLGERGQMQATLAYYRNHSRGRWARKARVISLHDRRNGQILSWTLLLPGFDGERVAFFYTRSCCRRRGYATALVRHIRARYRCRQITVSPWDVAGECFVASTRLA